MAQKKKAAAKRHKQQQKKHQRRSARVHKQQLQPKVARSNALAGNYSLPSDDLLADVAPLFPNGDINASKEEDLAETVLPVAWDSADLADEPEFAEIEISPLVAVQIYVEILQAEGLTDPADADELDDEERADTIEAALDEAAFRLLTPELRQQLIAGLTALRLRFHQEGKPNEVPRVSAVQLFLEIDQDGRIAATLGLVQEVARRSISAGFALAQRLSEAQENAEGEQANPKASPNET